MIAAEAATISSSEPHPRLPPHREPEFTDAAKELVALAAAAAARKDTGTDTAQRKPAPLIKAIDLTRYEAQSAVPGSTDDAKKAKAELASALRRAYAAQTFLSQRSAHLSLLSGSGNTSNGAGERPPLGRNAWLLGNYALEAGLKAVERELVEVKTEIDTLAAARRRAQTDVEGEIKTLEDTWRAGVGRAVEAEIAGEKLAREIAERRREAAMSGR